MAWLLPQHMLGGQIRLRSETVQVFFHQLVTPLAGHPLCMVAMGHLGSRGTTLMH